MIVADTSVWIADIRNDHTCRSLAISRELTVIGQVLVGDIVLAEVLRGALDDNHAAQLEAVLRTFPMAGMVGDGIAVRGARHCRVMRSCGVTMNKLPDLLSGAFCIENDRELLHCDATYDAMERFCGLRVLR